MCNNFEQAEFRLSAKMICVKADATLNVYVQFGHQSHCCRAVRFLEDVSLSSAVLRTGFGNKVSFDVKPVV